MTKISKTAKASMAKKQSAQKTPECPRCLESVVSCHMPMVATQIVKRSGMWGGMYWVCPVCNYREKIL